MPIPKTIHYCWFGGAPLPDDAGYYLSTWKKYCPAYEICEWNEANFDINCCSYVKEAYECKKWAFVSDYVRLKVLYDHGGIYMDTDVEVCKPFDDLLSYDAWSGFESETKIPTGTMAADKGNDWLRFLLTYYDDRHFIKADGSLDLTTNVETITRMTKEKYGVNLNNTFQIFGENNALFPFDYFCAKNFDNGKITRTKNTYTIHHFSGSWLSPYRKFRHKVKLWLVNLFGR